MILETGNFTQIVFRMVVEAFLYLTRKVDFAKADNTGTGTAPVSSRVSHSPKLLNRKRPLPAEMKDRTVQPPAQRRPLPRNDDDEPSNVMSIEPQSPETVECVEQSESPQTGNGDKDEFYIPPADGGKYISDLSMWKIFAVLIQKISERNNLLFRKITYPIIINLVVKLERDEPIEMEEVSTIALDTPLAPLAGNTSTTSTTTFAGITYGTLTDSFANVLSNLIKF